MISARSCKWLFSLALLVAASSAGAQDQAAPPTQDPQPQGDQSQPAPVEPQAEAAASQPDDATPPDAAVPGAIPPPPTQPLLGEDQESEGIARDVLALNRDLKVLEEQLMFPASSQVSVFVSVDVGNFFDLDSVQLKVDDKDVANYLYSDAQSTALLRGGVQQLYIGNLTAGQHELVAVFTGKGPRDQQYKRGVDVQLDKGGVAKFVELKITDSGRQQQPEFKVRIWE